ncbi:hypothetical protein MTP03_23890 [Tsukamurella sp. PLM1]|nr:hypothetical protein MTP03_23890 [Tsukamurella sp. PLM1]
MNGTRLERVTKNAPITTTKTEIATLTTTRMLVARADSRIPTMAITPRTTMIAIAPTFTGASSVNSSGGSPNRSARYPDQLRETTAAPSPNSSNRSQPMIHAKISPIVA